MIWIVLGVATLLGLGLGLVIARQRRRRSRRDGRIAHRAAMQARWDRSQSHFAAHDTNDVDPPSTVPRPH